MQSRLLRAAAVTTLMFMTGCAGYQGNTTRDFACAVAGATLGTMGAAAGSALSNSDSDAAIILPGLALGIGGAALCRQLGGEVAMEVAEPETEMMEPVAMQEMMDIEAMEVDQEPDPEVMAERAPAPIAQVLDGDDDGVPDDRDRCPDSLPLARVDADGCARVGELMAVLQEDIHFAFGKANLASSATAVLGKVAAALKANRNISVDVVGHTDNVGSDEYNLNLGRRRAQAAQDYLSRQGVAGSQLRVLSKGESAPVATNDNESGRALNRRVEFVVSGKSNGS